MDYRKRFYRALAAYLVLGALAGYQLEGELRAAVLLLLAALALLTWVQWRHKTVDK